MILPFDRDSSGMKEKVTVGWKIETECGNIECTLFRWVEVSDTMRGSQSNIASKAYSKEFKCEIRKTEINDSLEFN